MNRREFLLAAPLACTAFAALKTLYIDTHVHCFTGVTDRRFPYHPRAPYRPKAPATPRHLLKTMAAAGVDRAVIVHPEPYQDDHRFLEHCLELGRGKLKGTLLCFADRPGSLKQLPRLAKRGDIVAARIHAFRPDRLPAFGKPELRRLWKLAADHGLAIQLHFQPRWCAGFEPFIREFKDTPVIIDHLGRPLQDNGKEWDRVERWAALPHTYVKLSSLRSTPDARRAIAPYVHRLLRAYGPRRLLWGGGYDATATGKTYRAARDYVQTFLLALKPADQARVLGGNAATLMGFN